MDQDFAKRRIRTPLAEPTPPPPSSGMALLITGALTGIVIGLFIALLVYLSGVLPPPPGYVEVAETSFNDAEDSEGALTAELEREAARLQLEFYQELPNYEVVVDATPIAGSVPRTPATITATEITPSTENEDPPETREQNEVQQPAEPDSPAPASATVAETGAGVESETTSASPTVSAVSTGRYLLQAGAFQQQPAALAQLNRLLALGLDARVRQESMPGRTLYLVQAGPYESRDEMIRAERLLRGNSIESMRITLSQP